MSEIDPRDESPRLPERKNYHESLLPPLWLLVAAIFALFCYLISELREIVALLVVSFSIAYVIEPILRTLEKNKVSRPLGFVLVFVIAGVIVTLLILTVFPVLQREFMQLINNLPEYITVAKANLLPYYYRVQEYIGRESEVVSPEDFSDYVQGILPKVFKGVENTLLQGYSITLTLLNVALLPFMVFYISMNFPDYSNAFLRYFPESKRPKVSEILSEIDNFVSKFVRGQIIVSFILFILYTIGLGIVGVELWFLLAVIAGFGNLIPYLGTIIGIVLATLMSLITFGDFKHVLIVWAVFAVVQMIEGTLITPKVLGENVGLSPLIIIISIFVGGSLFGFLGILLAVPAAAILKVLSRHFHGWLLSKV